MKNITAALADLGISVERASRETVNSFTKHCDTGASYVVFVARHAVAVVNGVIYDTWDSSRRFVKWVAKVSREKFAEILAVLMGLKGLEIEICGNWLWIGGETKENKDALKGAGCKWASKKKLWYWHAGEWVKKVRRALTLFSLFDYM